MPNADDAPPWLREIDHTGDVGLDVTAPTLEVLFARAAEGLFRVLADLSAVKPRQAQTITVEAGDREALLAEWLTELNYRHVTSGWLFCRFEVQELSDRHLTARAHGEPYDAARHTVHTEVKAVTYHGLHVEETNEGWAARVIFDM